MSPVEVYQHFGTMYCLHLQSWRVSQASNQHQNKILTVLASSLHSLCFDHEDGGCIFLRNVCKLLPDYRTSHPRRLSSPWEPQVRHLVNMKRSIFWDITPCSPLSVNRRFGGTYRFHLQGRKNKFSKKPVCKQVARRRILLSGLHGIISQKMVPFITTTVRTSNATSCKYVCMLRAVIFGESEWCLMHTVDELNCMKSEAPAVARILIRVFCGVVPCGLIDRYQYFRRQWSEFEFCIAVCVTLITSWVEYCCFRCNDMYCSSVYAHQLWRDQ
jgi:hypothetical protein